jgi:hypothetical protein
MNQAPAHLPPTVGVLAADHDDISWQAQVSKLPMKTNGLLRLVRDFRLDNEKVNIAMGIGLSPSMRAEQDYLRVRSSRSQTAACLGNQRLVYDLHGLKS